MMGPKNPIQPLVDVNGVLRFKENAIVRHLLDWAYERGHGLNELAGMNFTQDDQEQFAQLIGYSLSGFGELSYVTDATYNAAATMVDEGLNDGQARIATLEAELTALRTALRDPMARLFGLHPDDLMNQRAGREG